MKSSRPVRAIVVALIAALTLVGLGQPATVAQAANYNLTTCNASELLTAISSAIATTASDNIYLRGDCTYTFTDDFGVTNFAFPLIPATATAGYLYIFGNGATVNRTTVDMGAFQIAANSALRLYDTTYSNFRGSSGGVVYALADSDVNLYRVTATANQVISSGGVLYCAGGAECEVYDSRLGANYAAYGGAIFVAANGVLNLYRTRLSTNIAGNQGGAIDVNTDGSADIYSSTFANNFASQDGGGIRCLSCDLRVFNGTFYDNAADWNESGTGDGGGIAMTGTFTTLPRLYNTVLSGNEDRNGASPSFSSDVFGVLNSDSFNNFISVNTGFSGVTNNTNGNKVGTAGTPLDPLLGSSVTRPGGLFLTRAPLANSPLINAGSNTYAIGSNDNRGTRRIIHVTVDIGAVEFKRPDSPVVINPANQGWLFRNYNAAGAVDFSFLYGQGLTDYQAVVGDWNNDDVDTQGVYTRFNASNIGVFALSNTFNGFDAVSLPSFAYSDASSSWLPTIGDWNGNGSDSVGVYRVTDGIWVLTNNNSSVAPSYPAFAFGGGPGVVPLAGDWDGDGVDSVGVFNFNTSRWILSNGIVGYAAVNFDFVYGAAGSYPIPGDWDGDGIDTPGLYNPVTGQWLLRNTNTTGAADIAFVYGQGSGLVGRAGQWKTVLPGNGTSPIREAVVTPDAPQIAPTFAP